MIAQPTIDIRNAFGRALAILRLAIFLGPEYMGLPLQVFTYFRG